MAVIWYDRITLNDYEIEAKVALHLSNYPNCPRCDAVTFFLFLSFQFSSSEQHYLPVLFLFFAFVFCYFSRLFRSVLANSAPTCVLVSYIPLRV